MADTVTVNVSSGTAVIATDQVTDGTLGTVQVQYTKLMDATLDSTNKAIVSSSGALKVDNSAVTQPISALSLPLPTGAATAAKQPALGTAGSASADVLSIQGVASMTALKVDGSAVTQPVSGTVTANAGTGTFTTTDANAQSQGSTTSGQKGFLELGAVTTAAPSYTTAQSSPLSLNTSGGLRVDGSGVTQPVSGTLSVNALPTGSNTIGAVNQNGTWTVQPGNTPNTTAWLVQTIPGTANGWSVNSQTGLTNTKVAVKASAGLFGGYMIFNPNSSVIYVQVFDVASASVTLGTTTPTYVIPIPATAGANLEIRNGVTHSTAITLAATTTATGSTAPSTALTGFFLYK